MKKRVLLACALIGVSQASFATSKRIAAMGGSTAIITVDDTNIDLFPQTINDINMMRLTNIHTASPNYAIITGEKGKKWGLYGGSAQAADFFNVYKSMGADSAIRLGVAVGRSSLEITSDDKETPKTANEAKNTYNNIDVQAIFGKNMGEREFAAYGRLAYGPRDLSAYSGRADFGTLYGNFEETDTVAGTATDDSGDANTMTINFGVDIREPRKIAIFNKMYANGNFSYSSNKEEYTVGTTSTRDFTNSTLSASGTAIFFDEVNVTENTLLVYGIGAGASITRVNSEDKAAPANESTTTTLTIGGPTIRMGLETSIKYGKLRFGFSRSLTALSYSNTEGKTTAGANKDESTSKSLNFLNSGSYSFAAGYGFEYKNLQIDVTVNNNLWTAGPQLVFDGTNGMIGTSADVIYTF